MLIWLDEPTVLFTHCRLFLFVIAALHILSIRNVFRRFVRLLLQAQVICIPFRFRRGGINGQSN